MGTARNWLLGCGAGCGVVLLVFVLVVGGSFYALRDVFRGFRQMEETRSSLQAEHGRISDFRPPADGRLAAARLEAFLAVRDSTSAAREDLARALAEDVPALQGEKSQGFTRFLRGLKAGVGFTGSLADYLRVRSAALLGHHLGLGEYLYIYALAYYSWLGKDPAAGPAGLDLDRKQDGHVVWGDRHGDWSKPEVRRHRLRVIIHDDLLPMLEGQLAAADSIDAASRAGLRDSATVAWRRDLAAEVDRLRADPERVPWQDGLPARLQESLAPYRARFEAQWSEPVNLLEVVTLEDRENGFEVRASSEEAR